MGHNLKACRRKQCGSLFALGNLHGVLPGLLKGGGKPKATPASLCSYPNAKPQELSLTSAPAGKTQVTEHEILMGTSLALRRLAVSMRSCSSSLSLQHQRTEREDFGLWDVLLPPFSPAHL